MVFFGSQIQVKHNYVLVMGKRSSGKTFFINQITKHLPKHVDIENIPRTEHTNIQSDKILNHELHFIDTPGFGSLSCDDAATFRDIAGLLSELALKGIKLSGILYMHNVATPDHAHDTMRNLRLLKAVCGDDCYQNVTIVINSWGKGRAPGKSARWKALERNYGYFGEMLEKGAIMVHHDGRHPDSASKIIEKAVYHDLPPVTLQLQRELTTNGTKLLCLTTAGIGMLESFDHGRDEYRNLRMELCHARVFKRLKIIPAIEHDMAYLLGDYTKPDPGEVKANIKALIKDMDGARARDIPEAVAEFQAEVDELVNNTTPFRDAKESLQVNLGELAKERLALLSTLLYEMGREFLDLSVAVNEYRACNSRLHSAYSLNRSIARNNCYRSIRECRSRWRGLWREIEARSVPESVDFTKVGGAVIEDLWDEVNYLNWIPVYTTTKPAVEMQACGSRRTWVQSALEAASVAWRVCGLFKAAFVSFL